MTQNPVPYTDVKAEVELSVVIPCYQTVAVLPELLQRLTLCLSQLQVTYEIILVDDASPEAHNESIEQELAQYPHVRYFELMTNVGQFRALMCGFAQARGKYIITMDDDLQHPPEEITKLYTHLLNHPELDVVIGAYKDKQHSTLRNLGSRLLLKINQYIFAYPADLKTSSFRCLRRELVESLLANQTHYPLIRPLIFTHTRRIANITIQHNKRSHNRSGYTNRRLIRTAFDNILNFSSLPLQIVALIGIVVSALSLILGIFLLFLYSDIVWASLFLGIHFYGGLLLLSVGLIGEYLIRILSESKGQPLYVIRRRIEKATT